jgi:phosphoglycolate phosphatase-like HAD superfamily hydrolase
MTREKGAVIFDLDGVLLDSGRDGFEWANEVRREADHDVDELRVLFETGSPEEFREKVSGYKFGINELKEVEERIAEEKT